MVVELGEGVWWLDLGSVNAYLVDDPGPLGGATDDDDRGETERESEDDRSGGLTLIDAGTPRDAGAIATGVAEAGYTLSDVERVLLTHYDLDHVGGLARLGGLDAPVSVGSADAPLLQGKRPNWRNRKGALQFVTRPFVGDPDLPIEPLEDGATVGGFQAYHTPGHTPGHVAYVNEARSAAFLGDLVLERSGRLDASPWIISYDRRTVESSVRSLAERIPDVDIAAMGHGVPFVRDGSDRLRECARHVE